MGEPPRLTDSELLILLAILRLGEEAYGVPIAGEIETITGRIVTKASLYATLERLERAGLIESELGEPIPERGGRAKRYFEVTPTGLRAVKAAQKAFAAMWKGLPQLKGNL